MSSTSGGNRCDVVTRRGSRDNCGSLSSSSSNASSSASSSSSSGCGNEVPQHRVALLHASGQIGNHRVQINLASGLWDLWLASDRSSDSSIHFGGFASGLISSGDLVGPLAWILGHRLPPDFW
jgi:hypothetical protein